jgi:hypothetical protein
MKFTFTILVIVLALSFEAKAQIINGGFEEWLGYYPKGWTGNTMFGNVSKVSPGYEGNNCFAYQTSDGYSNITILQNFDTIYLMRNVRSVSFWSRGQGTGGFGAIAGVVSVHQGKKNYGAPIDITGQNWKKTTYSLPFTPDSSDTDYLSIIFALELMPNSQGHLSIWIDDITLDTLTNSVNIKSSTSEPILLFPNPASKLVTLKYSENSIQPRALAIFDMLGNKVYGSDIQTQNVSDGKYEMNLTSLPNGTYLVKVQHTYGIIVKKLIISH